MARSKRNPNTAPMFPPRERATSLAVRARHELVVAEYLKNGGHAAKAVVAAGYAAKGAVSTAQHIFKLPHVRARIMEHNRARQMSVGVDAMWVLYQLVRLVQVDIRDMYNAEGKLKEIPEMTDDQVRLIAGFEVVQDADGARVKRVRLIDRLKVIEMIGKHMDIGVFRERPLAHLTLVTQEQALEELAREGVKARPPEIEISDAEVVG